MFNNIIYYLVILIIAILSILYIYYKIRYKFWSIQPVFHIHNLRYWLFPPGIINNNKLLEIKCIWSRNIGEEVPLMYWIQVQIQMEVCDIAECDLFQCDFKENSDYESNANDKTSIKGIITNKKTRHSIETQDNRSFFIYCYKINYNLD